MTSAHRHGLIPRGRKGLKYRLNVLGPQKARCGIDTQYLLGRTVRGGVLSGSSCRTTVLSGPPSGKTRNTKHSLQRLRPLVYTSFAGFGCEFCSHLRQQCEQRARSAGINLPQPPGC